MKKLGAFVSFVGTILAIASVYCYFVEMSQDSAIPQTKRDEAARTVPVRSSVPWNYARHEDMAYLSSLMEYFWHFFLGSCALVLIGKYLARDKSNSVPRDSFERSEMEPPTGQDGRFT